MFNEGFSAAHSDKNSKEKPMTSAVTRGGSLQPFKLKLLDTRDR